MKIFKSDVGNNETAIFQMANSNLRLASEILGIVVNDQHNVVELYVPAVTGSAFYTNDQSKFRIQRDGAFRSEWNSKNLEPPIPLSDFGNQYSNILSRFMKSKLQLLGLNFEAELSKIPDYQASPKASIG